MKFFHIIHQPSYFSLLFISVKFFTPCNENFHQFFVKKSEFFH